MRRRALADPGLALEGRKGLAVVRDVRRGAGETGAVVDQGVLCVVSQLSSAERLEGRNSYRIAGVIRCLAILAKERTGVCLRATP